MNNSPRQLFPTWYRRVDLSCDSATVEKRLKSLNTLTRLTRSKLWVNIIKIYLGEDVSQTDQSEFIDYFLKEDQFFPLEDNQQLLRVLAGTALCIRFTEYKTITTYYTALAILTSNFFDPFLLTDLPPVYKYASEAVKVSSLELRQPKSISSLDEVSAKLKEITDLKEDDEFDTDENVKELANSTSALINIINQLIERNKSVSEELDSLWWLYGEFSGTGKQRFDKLGMTKMCILGALDLFELTKEKVGLLRAKEFLGKVLQTSSKKVVKEEISVFDVINSLGVEEKKLFNDYYSESNIKLIPTISAIFIAQQIDTGEDWEPLFRKKFPGTDIKKKYNVLDISLQLYNELMLTCHL